MKMKVWISKKEGEKVFVMQAGKGEKLECNRTWVS